MPEARSELRPQRRIGRYQVRRKLGQGASSTVWLAWDPFNAREVALKLLVADGLTDPRSQRLLRRLVETEGALAGRLSHPHIVQIYDAVAEPGQAYVVMEYVPGGTLDRYCDPQRLLPVERVVELVFKTSRALDHAQRQGIIHRDIKPANLLLAREDDTGGDIKVSDFGTALVGATDRTQMLGVGSPAYMSPEQVRDEPLTHQTDIYSLGVVMYQLLTGRLPFEAPNSYGVLYQITHDTPQPPSALRSGVPPAMDAIVLKALEKDRSRRYASWEAFGQDLVRAFGQPARGGAGAHALADSGKFTTMRRLTFFADFPDTELWEVLRFTRWLDVPAGRTVMHQGEAGRHFCVLVSGVVEVSRNGHQLALLRDGEVFGEMAVVSKRFAQRGADVVARADSRLLVVPATALELASEACRMYFYRAFLEVLTHRLAHTSQALVGA